MGQGTDLCLCRTTNWSIRDNQQAQKCPVGLTAFASLDYHLIDDGVGSGEGLRPTRQDEPFFCFVLPTPAAACMQCRRTLLHVRMYVDLHDEEKKWERHACGRVMMPGALFGHAWERPHDACAGRWRWEGKGPYGMYIVCVVQ